MALESLFQAKCQNLIRQKGGYIFKTHGDIYLKKGTPDLIACIFGKFIAFEIKRPDGKGTVSEAQQIHKRQIENAGGKCYFVDSIQQLTKILEDLERDNST